MFGVFVGIIFVCNEVQNWDVIVTEHENLSEVSLMKIIYVANKSIS